MKPASGDRPLRSQQRRGYATLSNEAAIYRVIGALLLEQTNAWSILQRYLMPETLASVGDTALVSVPAVAR